MDAIKINCIFIFQIENHKHIIVEGLYLFIKELNLNEIFDIKIFLNCEEKLAKNRLTMRNF